MDKDIVKKLRLRANTFSTTPECDKTLMEDAAELIESLQARLNDVVPVVRGEWIRMDETQALLSVEWKCSQCGQEIRVDGILTAIGAGWKYCPNCGADMRGAT